jgi:hypothetical protein
VLKWDELNAWSTPTAKFFRVAHYQKPLGPVIDAAGIAFDFSVGKCTGEGASTGRGSNRRRHF